MLESMSERIPKCQEGAAGGSGVERRAILTLRKESAMSTSTLTSKGQITLPKDVRSHLRLTEGDRLEFLISDDGTVRLLPVSGSVRRLQGMFRREGAPAQTLEQMEDAISRFVAEDQERIRTSGR